MSPPLARLRVLLCALLLFACLAGAVSSVQAGDAGPPTKRVVIAFAESPDFLAYPGFLAKFKAGMSRQTDVRLDYSIEYLALNRGAKDPQYAESLKQFLTAKYRTAPPDVVVMFGGSGVGFMLANGEAIFPGKPKVLCGATMASSLGPIPPNYTVIGTSFDPTLAADAIWSVLPSARSLVVVMGASPAEAKIANEWREAFSGLSRASSIEFAPNRSLMETLEYVSHLSRDKALIFHTYFQDADGRSYYPVNVLYRLCQEASVPVFVTQDTFVGLGGVGGYVISNSKTGAEAARVVGDILAGNQPLSLENGQTTAYLYDWRQLRRWGIPEARLPRGAEVEEREPSAWHAYRWQIVLVAVLLLSLSAYIVIMHLNRGRHARMQRELARSEQKLRAVLEAMPSAIVTVDRAGMVTGWNREAEALCGTPGEQALGRPLAGAWPRLAQYAARLDAATLGQEPRNLERLTFAKDGEELCLSVSAYAVEEGDGHGVVLRVDDVTRQMRLEELMIQNEKILSLGGLAAGMAHEINNPLGVVLQSVQNIGRRLSASFPKNLQAARECSLPLESLGCYLERRGILSALEDIRAAGERAAAIVRNTLDFSRAGGSSHEPCDLVELLENTLEIARNDFDLTSNYDVRKVRLEFNHAPHPVMAPCSRSQMGQVFLNLIKNAVQAMAGAESPLAAPTLAVSVRDDGEYCHIRFEDNGPGMPPEVRKRIFEPFFTTKRQGKGTGLGLSVSFFIVTRNHGGRMNVESEPGKGCCFTVSLPKQAAVTD